MLLSEVMELPASEIEFWRAYYNIFPFPQDREDYRTARICEAINLNTQGLGFKKKDLDFFLPDYLKPAPAPKSEEQKMAEERAFVQMAVAAGFAKMENKE